MQNKLNLIVIIRSVLFWLLSAMVLPIYCILGIICIPLGIKLRHRVITSGAYYFNFLLKHVAGIKYQIHGQEHLTDDSFIFVSNHQSAWETIALSCILPPSVWIMKQELLKVPFFGWAIRGLLPIAIDRKQAESAMSQIIHQGKERFKQGFAIILFPEGTRVKPKQRKSFKQGAAKLALNLQVPIIPIAHNAGYYLPKNSFWLYAGTVQVIIGAPINANDASSYTQQIQTWIYQQLDQLGA